MGVFLGCCTALLVDAVDNKIQGAEEIEAMQIPVLGIAPQIEAIKANPRAIMLDSATLIPLLENRCAGSALVS